MFSTSSYSSGLSLGSNRPVKPRASISRPSLSSYAESLPTASSVWSTKAYAEPLSTPDIVNDNGAMPSTLYEDSMEISAYNTRQHNSPPSHSTGTDFSRLCYAPSPEFQDIQLDFPSGEEFAEAFDELRVMASDLLTQAYQALPPMSSLLRLCKDVRSYVSPDELVSGPTAPALGKRFHTHISDGHTKPPEELPRIDSPVTSVGTGKPTNPSSSENFSERLDNPFIRPFTVDMSQKRPDSLDPQTCLGWHQPRAELFNFGIDISTNHRFSPARYNVTDVEKRSFLESLRPPDTRFKNETSKVIINRLKQQRPRELESITDLDASNFKLVPLNLAHDMAFLKDALKINSKVILFFPNDKKVDLFKELYNEDPTLLEYASIHEPFLRCHVDENPVEKAPDRWEASGHLLRTLQTKTYEAFSSINSLFHECQNVGTYLSQDLDLDQTSPNPRNTMSEKDRHNTPSTSDSTTPIWLNLSTLLTPDCESIRFSPRSTGHNKPPVPIDPLESYQSRPAWGSFPSLSQQPLKLTRLVNHNVTLMGIDNHITDTSIALKPATAVAPYFVEAGHNISVFGRPRLSEDGTHYVERWRNGLGWSNTPLITKSPLFNVAPLQIPALQVPALPNPMFVQAIPPYQYQPSPQLWAYPRFMQQY